MLMRLRLLCPAITVFVACHTSGTSAPGPRPDPEPSRCPADHEVCQIDDDGVVEVICDGNTVLADDLTRTAYCTAGGTFADDFVCETGGRGDPAQLHVCATGCDSSPATVFDSWGEYQAWVSNGGPMTKCR